MIILILIFYCFTIGCGHCQNFAPVFDDIALEVRDRGVFLAKVNCERFHQLCQNLHIKAYPTVYFYPGQRSSGNHPEKISSQNFATIVNYIETRIEELLLQGEETHTHDEL